MSRFALVVRWPCCDGGKLGVPIEVLEVLPPSDLVHCPDCRSMRPVQGPMLRYRGDSQHAIPEAWVLYLPALAEEASAP